MKISVLGLGCVGAVSAGCLARDGHEVIAADQDRTCVDRVNAGRAPVIEKDLAPIFAEQVAAGRLRATTETMDAVRRTDVVLVCVEVKLLRRACEQIGRALARHEGAPVIVIRTTVLPGTLRGMVIPVLEKFSAKRAGEEFGVCVSPDFLRAGSAVHDYVHPPKTVIGELNRASGDVLCSLHAGRPGPLIRTDLETAEMVKYADNAWHALKVGFANEIGNLCKAVEVDAHRLMDIFCQDQKLNLSPAYLRPGFAFGGKGLSGDLRALLHKAAALELKLPILGAILPSNALQVERGVQAVIDRRNTRVGILGLSFKAGTDDLRDSPMVELAERLLGKGYDLRLYDRHVPASALQPHLSRLMVTGIDEMLRHAQTLVIGNAAPEFADVPRRIGDGQTILDFVRVCDSRTIVGVYEGLCW